MAKINWLVVVLFIALGVSLYFNFKTENHVPESGKMVTLENDKAELKKQLDYLQNKYEANERYLQNLDAELLKSRAVVKRSEQKLSELLKRERHAQIENKRLIEKYSNYQLDSAFMAMYPVPDSVRR